jgi:hypothetical protein
VSGIEGVAFAGLAAVLGARHAVDPDHVAAVGSIVASEGRAWRPAARLGAAWGTGHGAVLIVVGVPLIFLEATVPAWLVAGCEAAIGALIATLAVRLVIAWRRGPRGSSRAPRTTAGAAAVGMLHGLAGTGATVLLLLGAAPDEPTAALALALFASATVVSMAAGSAVLALAFGLRAEGRNLAPILFAAGALAFGALYLGSAAA